MNSSEKCGESPNKSGSSELEKGDATNESGDSPVINSNFKNTAPNNESNFCTSSENEAGLQKDPDKLENENLVLSEASHTEVPSEADLSNSGVLQNNSSAAESVVKAEGPLLSDSANSSTFCTSSENEAGLQKDPDKLENENLVLSEASHTEVPSEADLSNSGVLQNNSSAAESVVKAEGPLLSDSANSSTEHQVIGRSASNGSEAVIIASKPLCANYRSDSDSEFDSESDSSSSSGDTTTSSDCESEDSCDSNPVKSKTVKGEKKLKGDLSLTDLPPIENLTISVPEDACVEIGTIISIVDTLVIVESYNGSAALDIDSVLFLDCGRKTLGKVFDILGPITEPVYAVRFNSREQIDALNIKKDMKVYYAPKTEHTTFVFLSEVLKHKGSDASWKDNAEAPPEFQDFSDDEEERLFKNKQTGQFDGENPNPKEQNKSRKRPFNKVKHTSEVSQPTRFRNPNFPQQRPHFQRNPAINQFATPPPFARPTFPNPIQGPPFPYRVPTFPGTNPLPPHYLYPPRITGPPFPTFGHLPFGQNFQQPFYQQRTHAFPQVYGAWGRAGFGPPLPPPPPPPASQNDRNSASEDH